MPFKSTQYRRLDRKLKPYGLYIKATSGHNQIVDADGKRVMTFASTPKDIDTAEKNTVHQLIKLGYLPKSERL